MLGQKITAAITALLTAASIMLPQFEAMKISAADTAEILAGDVTLDSTVGAEDVRLLGDYLLGTASLAAAQCTNADMNGDGILNAYDFAILKRTYDYQVALEGYTGLVINEVCSSNKESFKDAAGASPDWVELYNGSGKDLTLDGIGVSDGAKNKFKFTFPEGTVLAADDYLLICCDDAVNQAEGEYHAAFKISATGETIYLTHPQYGEIDAFTVPELDADVTYGRYANGSESLAYLTPTPGATNDTAENLNLVEKPVFSVEGGFYDAAFLLGLSDSNGNEILYTTDGSDPRTSETAVVYDGEIDIYDNTGDPNKYSALTDITLNNYSAPTTNVDKGIVIRAVCRTADGRYSAVATNGYFIGKTASWYSDFKVVSLSTDGDNLFDEDNGIYMVGSGYYEWLNSADYYDIGDTNSVHNPTNYNKEGKEYEIPMNVQVFENGKLAYTSDVGARISGNWSRGYAQKSIRLYARSEYGDSKMKYEFIEGLTDINGNPIEEYDKVTLRNGGTDNSLLHFRDMFIQQLCVDRAMDIQGGEPCIVFIDGEFWGFYFIREKQDTDYVESHYGIDKNNVTMLKIDALDEGSETVAAEYQAFLDWAADADMTVEENYQRVCDTVDIQNFMDHVVIETYINNTDWATDYLNNWIAWRATETDASNTYADGKWRYMLYDLDFSADYFSDGRTMVGFDTLGNMYTGESPYNFVPMFYNLLNNETFRAQFYNTYIDIMKNNFDPVEVSEKLDAYTAMYEGAIRATNTRFGQEWVNINYDDEVEQFRNYFINRRNLAKLYLDQLYGMAPDYTTGSNLVGNASTWSYYGNGSAVKSAADNSFTMTANIDAANSWDIQSQSPQFTIENGKTYRITFEAACSTSAQLGIEVNRQSGTSWPSCFSRSGITLTPELQEFSYTFVSSVDTAANWRLCFNYGGGAGVYTIKNATITEINYEMELVNELGDWHLYNPSGEAVLTENSLNSVTVLTTALPNETWEAQAFYSGMVLSAGVTYTYSFTIKSDTETSVSVHVQKNFDDYAMYSHNTVSVGTEATTYTYTFTADDSCMDASICFDCGASIGTVEISDVSLVTQS